MDSHDQPPIDPSGSITMLYQQWRQGDQESLNKLITRFWPRLLALANSTLAGRVKRAADAEDALQSAMISFFDRGNSGGFHDQMDRDDLWNVLGVITVRKAYRLQEREQAQKRGSGKVMTGQPLENSPAAPSEAELDILCGEMLEMLDDDLRAFAVLRMMGYKNREIAEKIGCTERKVERKLNLIRAEWEHEFENWKK